MLLDAFLIVTAILFVPYGVLCFFRPEMLAKSAGVETTSATGRTEVRAMYGGLQGAIGILAVVAFFQPALTNAFLVTILTIAAGLLIARVVGLIMDRGYTGYTGMALGFETILVVGALFFLLG